MLNNDAIYFDRFGVEYILRGTRRVIGSKNMQTNIFKAQAYDSVMWDIFALDLLTLCLEVRLD